MIGDLHCHTRLSDGSMGIEDVISYAKRMGISFLSITDHDTMSGNMRAAVLGKRYGVEIIPGSEISCTDPDTGRKLHILCYMPDAPERLEGLFVKIQEERRNAGAEMVKKVMRYYPITLEHVLRYTSGSNVIYKMHIMNTLMDLGYCDSIFCDLYSELFNVETGSCFVNYKLPGADEVLSLIHEAGGIAVLAHPKTYDSIDFLKKAAADGRLDGVELWHPDADEKTMQVIADIAKENKLLVTGGTDFHGMYRKDPCPLSSCITPEYAIDALFAFKNKKA